jgi:hypothetical protein
MSRLVIHSPDAVRQRFNNADRPSTDLQKRLLHCSSSPKPSHPNLNMFLSNESKRIRMVRAEQPALVYFFFSSFHNLTLFYAGA